MHSILRPACAALALLGLQAHAAPPANGHPILGAWKITVFGGACHERYHFRPDGILHVTSAEEVAESAYEISAKPSAKGFYQLTDKILRDNGKPDCGGETMTVGHEAINYIRFHPDGRSFVMCAEEEIGTCAGPFRRDDAQES
jgi:hypothetical protein